MDAITEGETMDTSAPPLPRFRAGDIILFAGQGDLYSRVARRMMRLPGEGPTYSVHTAQFISARYILEMDMVARIKTIDDVLHKRGNHDMWQRRGFEVWRCRTLTRAQREALARQTLAFRHRRFGGLAFLMHLLDGLISQVARRDVYAFRRLNHLNRYPVCSEITAVAYDAALHYQFGVAPDCADPDQIYDWVTSHPAEWEQVYCLAEFPRAGRR
jgi:hypothetical protein